MTAMVAEGMRDRLRQIGLEATPEGAVTAQKERKHLEQTIKGNLPQLQPGDLLTVYLVVISLADDRMLGV